MLIQFATSLPLMYLIKITYKDVHIYKDQNNHHQKKQLHIMLALHLEQRPIP